MSYKDKPQLRLYKFIDSAFVLQAIIDDYQEISFSHNLYEAGDFTITINYNIPNALKFERGMFVQFGNDSYMFGEILTINDAIGQDGKGSQIRTITGKDSRYLFKRRIIKNLNNVENWAMTDKGELCLRELVKAQCGSGAEAKRQLPIANTIPQSADAIGKEYSVAESFSNLYDTLVTIATQSEIGWRVKFDGTLTLEVYEGNDLSAQVQFSTDFDSLSNGQFSDSAESYANTIYVGGKGTGSDRDIYEGESAIEGESPSGLDRFEAWDNQSSMTSESEYEAEALSMLTQYGQTINVSGNGLAQCPYIFKENYDVGDVITLAFSGKSAKAQILSVTEHWTWGQYGIEFSFGKPQNDLSRQLQLILKQIQKASNKTTTTSSVRYYEIPTDTSQPKADVIYDTIGFTGTVGSGATFQLYWDSEKTGAKTYHVYFKQLDGTGKLTLTTGVSGKQNLILNAGTYVAIIYVDGEGNVSSEGATATSAIQTGNTQPATSGGVADAISSESSARNTAIENAINALDVSEVGGDGKYISAISETDGKISATASDLATTVASGNNQPVTSDGVSVAIQDVKNIMSSLPTDAVLHYSFDDVPDYPDGTAVYRKNNWTTNDGWSSFANNGTISVEDGKLTSTRTSLQLSSFQKGWSSTSEMVLKLELVDTANTKISIYAMVGSDYQNIGTIQLLPNVPRAGVFIFPSNSTGIMFRNTTNVGEGKLRINYIYIGDGSYSTPIIDNANGQNNATNNGGIATKGVSGKGAYFLNGKYAKINNGFLFAPNFSISLWIKPDNNTNGLQGIILRNGQLLIRNGDTSENFLMFILTGANGTLLNRQNIGSLLPPNVWTNLIIVRNTTTFLVYTNGIETYRKTLTDSTIGEEVTDFLISQSNLTRPQTLDDLLIFDRALTETEVMALYLNKANTPKYYSKADWKLEQMENANRSVRTIEEPPIEESGEEER